MFRSTVSRLRCPSCGGVISLSTTGRASGEEIVSGDLQCRECQGQYPVLGGVAVLVPDVFTYLLEHVKGISKTVPDSEIPAAIRGEYLEAKGEIEVEHIEEDLEADRVTSLYLACHYLHAGAGSNWWKPQGESPAGASTLIDSLIREHWDHGPASKISGWVDELAKGGAPVGQVVELGCGVGGLARTLDGKVNSYLGVDSSFASIALGRHLALGTPYPGKIAIPNDLLQGQLTREVSVSPPAKQPDGSIDLIVGEIENAPVVRGAFDLSLALNAIDMMPEPRLLPEAQYSLLRPGGVAIQSCPYIWHESVARELREILPDTVRDSASAAEWLYEQSGLKIEKRLGQVPWLFFKHVRQLEIYSVHMFLARRT